MALKQNLSQYFINNTFIKFTLICVILTTTFVVPTSAKNFDLDVQQQFHHNHHHHSHNRRLQRRDSSLKDATNQHCNEVRGYFESIDIKLPEHFNEKGEL